jgi:PAS domain S-box-containing protein
MQTALPASSLLPLENLIDYTPPTVGVEATIWDAITLMNQYQPLAEYILVVERWRIVGSFSSEDVLQVVKSQIDLKNTKITQVMRTPAILIKYSQLQDTKSILQLFADLKEPILIEDEKEQLVGYITPEKIAYWLLKDYQSRITQAEQVSNKKQKIIKSKNIDIDIDIEKKPDFQLAIESSKEGIIITDVADNIICLNSSFTKIFNYTSETLNALGGMSFLWKDTGQYQELLATIEKGESCRSELEFTNYKGDVLYIDVRTDAIKNAADKTIGMISIYTNITEEVKTQQTLQLKNTAFDVSNNGIAIFDVRLASKPIVYANSEFKRICDDSILHGCESKNYFLENLNLEINKLLKLQHNSSSKHYNLTLNNYCRDGREFWYQLSISPIFNKGKRITHYICMQTDVTKRKQIEMSLFITRKKLQYMLFSSTGVIYSSEIHQNYSVTFITDNVVNITGFEAEDILCDSNFWINHIHPEDIQLFIAGTTNIFTHEKINLEYRFLHKDNYYIWIYDQFKLVKDDADNPLEIIGYRIDISERKKLEEDLKLALDKEKEVNELKSSFVSMTSHEFRTPLSTILSSSELLENYRNKWDEKKQLKHFNRIKKAVEHMINLLNDVLFFDKAKAGKLDCNPEELDLVEYSRKLIDNMQINQDTNKINKSNINIQFITNKTKLIGYLDEKILAHILNNLLSNAIKYSKPETTVKFSLNSQESQVLFEIQDEGIGIPSEDLPSLFDSFHRCKNVGNIQGTGLGLSIVKKCVDILQGDIKVTSEVGVGTKFIISIPLKNCC